MNQDIAPALKPLHRSNLAHLSAARTATGSVWSCNEWGPLEEVVVGVVDGACWPPWHRMLEVTMPRSHHAHFKKNGGKPVDPELVGKAREELDTFARILEKQGVTVVRPDCVDHSKPFETPNWKSSSGLYAAMPRDVVLVVGDMLIEAPMAWRCRYFEIEAYRDLLKHYFRRGARWIAGPRPTLQTAQYTREPVSDGRVERLFVSEFEPTFDAADFVRFGYDLVAQKSHVTNEFGIEWVRRHLPPGYQVHVIDVDDDSPMHIDATLLPLAAGKLLVNPERLPKVPKLFEAWEVRPAPLPGAHKGPPLYMSSNWISMNMLSLDERRIMVEQQEVELIGFLKSWGFEPIPCPFRHFMSFGGSFHCATLDVRRRGGPERLLHL
jgi:glycine amidinotransferase